MIGCRNRNISRSSHDTSLPRVTVFYGENIPERSRSIMKRLVDPVLGLLLAQICCVRGVDVEQSPPAQSLQEGASSTLWCNFSTTLVSNVQWYRQKSGGHLDHLFFIPSGTKQNGRLNATTVVKERRISLYISSAQITDSATYLCAGEHSAAQAPAACTETLQPQSHHRAFTLLIIPHL
uniref:Ig-like domain-containing protein n=1 Tax=Sus scrofa TaxID=9823 RepID=A0A4X1UXB0_PIG